MSKEMVLFNEQNGGIKSFCSFPIESAEDKVKLFNMTTDPDKALGDCIGDVIAVTDVYVEVVDLTPKDDNGKPIGEPQQAPRTILIAEDGTSYACVSTGIYNSLCRLIGIFGMPTWKVPIKLKVKQISKGKNRILSLALVSDAKK